MSSSSLLTATTLTSRVQQAILDLIDDARLAPGESLPSTAALSERFEVSRPVVREALSALHATGVIELMNGRNAIVRRLDDHLISLFLSRALVATGQPLASLMEVRGPLEIQAARLAAQRATEEDGRWLVEEVRRMATIADDGDAYALADLELHARIAELTGNPALIWFGGAVRHRVFDAMQRIRAHREQHGLVGHEQAEHMTVVAAIASGDGPEAERAMRQHMEATSRIVDAIEQADA